MVLQLAREQQLRSDNRVAVNGVLTKLVVVRLVVMQALLSSVVRCRLRQAQRQQVRRHVPTPLLLVPSAVLAR